MDTLKAQRIPQQLKVMTFNIRIDAEEDGLNHADNRKQRILDVIKSEAPDIIGFQEVLDHRRDWLRAALAPEYVFLGGGRETNYRGECCPIAYRASKFELIGMETFWLSDTPDVAGSRYEHVKQSHLPRYAIAIRLKHHSVDEPILFVNTHLDHRYPTARRAAFEQLAGYLQSKKGIGVLVGDFNAQPASDEVKYFVAHTSALGYRDTTDKIQTTFHGFGAEEAQVKIDYVFTNAEVVESHAVEDLPVKGVYCSDHYPISVTLELWRFG